MHMQDEDEGNPTFCWRPDARDRRDMSTIIDLDPDIPAANEAGARTEALRAALRDYARKLRRRAERAA
jgi:hypothetical protein